MSLLAKMDAAMAAKDENLMNEIFHDDYKFTMHASGNVLGKADVIKWAMSGDINKDKVRVLFENDEIGVEHSFVTFNDGNNCLLYTSPSPRDLSTSRMPSSA